MNLELFHTDKYKSLIKDHLFNTVAFLLDNDIEFAIAVEMRHVSFEPVLPSYISSGFNAISLFVMSGHTLDSAYLEENDLFFEAGFGEEGIGSTLRVPLLSIKQILVDDYPVAINISEPKRKVAKPKQNNSMEALLSNPENKKLLKSKNR